MGKQDFLLGGFYGKVGAFVGQRWKDIKTLRAYTKPHNANTPQQKTQRGKFSKAVVYAQSALISNWNCTFFDDPHENSWNIRMSTAIELQKRSSSFLECLPLIPLGNTPPFLIVRFEVEPDTVTGEVTFTITGNLPSVPRKYGIYMTNHPETTNSDDVYFVVGETSAEHLDQIVAKNVFDFLITEETQFRIVSIDDKDSNTDMVLSASLSAYNPAPVVVPFDTTIVGVVNNEAITTIQFAQEWIDAPITVQIGVATPYIFGNKLSVTPSASNPFNLDGKVAITISQSDFSNYNWWVFADDSTLEVKKAEIVTRRVVYLSENKVEGCQEGGSPVRPFNIGTVTPSISNNKLELVFGYPSSLPSITLPSVSLSSLVNGAEKELQWDVTSETLTGGRVKATYAPTIPDGQTQRSFGGWGLKDVTAIDKDFATLETTFHGVTFQGGAVRPSSSISGSFDWSFAPSWECSVSSSYDILLQTDLPLETAIQMSSFGFSLKASNNNFGVSDILTDSYTPSTAAVGGKPSLYVAKSPNSPVRASWCYAEVSEGVYQIGLSKWTFPKEENISVKNDVRSVNLAELFGWEEEKIGTEMTLEADVYKEDTNAWAWNTPVTIYSEDIFSFSSHQSEISINQARTNFTVTMGFEVENSFVGKWLLRESDVTLMVSLSGQALEIKCSFNPNNWWEKVNPEGSYQWELRDFQADLKSRENLQENVKIALQMGTEVVEYILATAANGVFMHTNGFDETPIYNTTLE